MKLVKVILGSVAVCAAALLVLSGAAWAASITIHDLSETVFITDDTGGRFTSQCDAFENCPFQLVGPQGTVSFSLNFPGGVNLLEADGSLSDFLSWSTIKGPIVFAVFLSDISTGEPITPFPGPTVLTLTEDGTPQATWVITWFNNDGTNIGSDTIFIQSDIEGGNVPVPEPSTWLMALSGLALWGVPRLRRTLLA